MAEISYDVRALAAGLDDWTGGMTINGYGPTFTSQGVHSAIELAMQARGMGTVGVDPSFSLSISDAYVTLYNPEGSAFTMAFSGNTGTRLGFASTSYSGQNSYTGENQATGMWSAGFADHCIRVDEARALANPRGTASAGGGTWVIDNFRTRLGTFSILQTVARSDAEVLAYLLTTQLEPTDPFVEVIDSSGSYWSGWPTKYKVSPAGGVSQIYRVEIEGVRQR